MGRERKRYIAGIVIIAMALAGLLLTSVEGNPLIRARTESNGMPNMTVLAVWSLFSQLCYVAVVAGWVFIIIDYAQTGIRRPSPPIEFVE